MTRLRLIARSWHRLTLALAVIALAVRLIVPAGFMPDAERFAVVLCTGHGPMAMSSGPAMSPGMTMVPGTAMAAAMVMPHDRAAPSDPGDASGQPCGFGDLHVAALPAVDLVILLTAVAFIVSASRYVRDIAPARTRRLRPPLRAPPAPHFA